MKNILYPVLFLFLCFLQAGCDAQGKEKFKRTYVLENGTNHKIELQFFRAGIQQHTYENKHILNEYGATFSQYVIEDVFGEADASGAYQGPDRLIIVFDNNRKAIIEKNEATYDYMLTGIDKNILSDEPYTVESNTLYRYVFTEEDYENATVCPEENCTGQ